MEPKLKRARYKDYAKALKCVSHHRSVGAVEESVLEEKRGTVGQEGVPLHLSKADATGPLAPLNRLVGQRVYWACCPDLMPRGDPHSEAYNPSIRGVAVCIPTSPTFILSNNRYS